MLIFLLESAAKPVAEDAGNTRHVGDTDPTESIMITFFERLDPSVNLLSAFLIGDGHDRHPVRRKRQCLGYAKLVLEGHGWTNQRRPTLRAR